MGDIIGLVMASDGWYGGRELELWTGDDGSRKSRPSIGKESRLAADPNPYRFKNTQKPVDVSEHAVCFKNNLAILVGKMNEHE